MGRRPATGTEGTGSGREPRLEIELEVVDDPAAVDTAAHGERGRGRTVVVAVVAVAAAIAGSVVLVDRLSGEDRAAAPVESPPPTSARPEAPPRPGGSEEPPLAGGLAMPEFEGIVLPALPATGTLPVDAAGRPVLLDAVRLLRVDAPRRSTTRVSLGYGGFETTATILRDPVTDRYLLTADVGGQASTVIIDVPDEVAYIGAVGEGWSAVEVGDLARRAGVADVGELYQRLLNGPVRPDTIERATFAVPDDIGLDGPSSNATYRLRLPGDAVPLWQVHFLAPSTEFDPARWPSSLVYDVYVEEEITAVVGLSEVDGVPQLVDHRIERLAERIPIVLPVAPPIGRR